MLEPKGLPASELTADQQALLLDVVRQWAGIANEGAAEARMSEIEDNLEETYFAWYGPTKNGEPVYYRTITYLPSPDTPGGVRGHSWQLTLLRAHPPLLASRFADTNPPAWLLGSWPHRVPCRGAS